MGQTDLFKKIFVFDKTIPEKIHGAVDKAFGWKVILRGNHLEVAGSIPTTGQTNK